jgi:hypothetical protein
MNARVQIVLLATVMLPMGMAQAGEETEANALQPDAPLMSMTSGFLEGHPDLEYRNEAIDHDQAGDFAGARKRYLQAARYGDKPSQARLGEMYWNGQGVAADHVTGFLWMALAAERSYPMFTDLKMAYWNSLTPAEQDQARRRDKSMIGEYGDAAAKPRQEKVMRRELSRSSGSLLGYNSQAMSITAYGHGSIGSAIDPEKFYAKEYWQPDLYWQTEDKAWRRILNGTVTVGDVQNVLNSDAAKDSVPKAEAPQTQPPSQQ